MCHPAQNSAREKKNSVAFNKKQKFGFVQVDCSQRLIKQGSQTKKHQVQEGATNKTQSERPQTQMHWTQENGRRECKREEEGG